MIQVNALSKSYYGYPVLKNVNMILKRGEIIGFVGANGSGKSILLKMICGFILPDEGTIRVDGKLIGKDLDFPPNTGIMIEEPGFFQAYSARQNLRLFASHRGLLSNAQVDEAIAAVGLDPSNRKSVGKYSVGMRQRLCFAQATMEKPDLLILDEPFNSLDQGWAKYVKEEIIKYASKQRLIILTSHRPDDIESICTRAYHFENGEVTEKSLSSKVHLKT